MKKKAVQEKKPDDAAEWRGIRLQRLSQFRARLSQNLDEVESSSSIIALGRKKQPKTLVIPFDRYSPIFSRDYKLRLAFMIVENLLNDAPAHIRSPQLGELARLDKADLILLVAVERLPLGKAQEKALRGALREPKALDRLLRRRQIADAIADAKREGLYESAEHLTSSLDVTPRDEAAVDAAPNVD